MPKVLVIHRNYRVKGGEDFFLTQTLQPALNRLGIRHDVVVLAPLFSKKSSLLSDLLELVCMFLGLERLRPSYFKISHELKKPDLSHVLFNNFIPTVSLALPARAKELGLKTLWWAHNARLTCANGLLYDGQAPCHDCLLKGSRYSFFYDCQRNPMQSFI